MSLTRTKLRPLQEAPAEALKVPPIGKVAYSHYELRDIESEETNVGAPRAA